MKRVVRFRLKRGGSVLVEVEAPPQAGIKPAGRAGKAIENATLTFEEALGKIQPAAECMVERFRALATKPDQVAVEFGLKLSAEAGALIASTGIETNLKVTLTWKRQESERGPA